MQNDPISRAFELARERKFKSVEEVARALSREGYINVNAHFNSPSFRRQLIAVIRSGEQ